MASIKQFVVFSAGPVGDQLVLIDAANYFFETTGVGTTIISKHPSKFLSDFSIPYVKHITEIPFTFFSGYLSLLVLILKSIFQKNYFILFFPIPLPLYLKFFIYFIRFFTRSRFVGFNLEGSKSFPIGRGYASVLGENNTIPMQAEPFAKSTERMLLFMGFNPTPHIPNLIFAENKGIKEKFGIGNSDYIALHITPSHQLRTLPAERWNSIIRKLIELLPNTLFVFTGGSGDSDFIKDSLVGLPAERYLNLAGKTNANDLMSLYSHASACVSVQTGNALAINMLHLPAVIVNIKGTAMFYYDFNKNATILFSEKDCTCDPFETECNMVSYKGIEYMSCVFNINDDDVVKAIMEKLRAR